MFKVYLMYYTYPGHWGDMKPYMYIHADEYNEALSVGKDICESRGYVLESLEIVDDWINVNNMKCVGM